MLNRLSSNLNLKIENPSSALIIKAPLSNPIPPTSPSRRPPNPLLPPSCNLATRVLPPSQSTTATAASATTTVHPRGPSHLQLMAERVIGRHSSSFKNSPSQSTSTTTTTVHPRRPSHLQLMAERVIDRHSYLKNLEVAFSEMAVPRGDTVAQHTPRMVDAGKRYFDMEIIIRPKVEDIRDYLEQLRDLLATDGLDDEGRGYTYRVLVLVVSKAGKQMVIILIKRSDNLCTDFRVLEDDGVSYEVAGFHCWLGQRKANAATPGPGDGLLLLPRQRTGAPPMWLHIKMVEMVTRSWIIAVVRSDNMYCKAIINMGWQCYELGEKNPDPARRLPPEYNAMDAGFGVSYHSMIGCRFEDVVRKLIDEDLGYRSVVRSVQILSRYHPATARLLKNYSEDRRRAGKALAGLIFSVFEPARMNFHYSGLDPKNDGRDWRIGKKLTVQLWDLAQNWRNMSYPVLDWRDTGYRKWTGNEYLDRIGMTSPEDTVEALCIVLNSTEGYYGMVQRPTRMKLVLEREKKRLRAPDGDGTFFFPVRSHTAAAHVDSRRGKDWFQKKRRTD